MRPVILALTISGAMGAGPALAQDPSLAQQARPRATPPPPPPGMARPSPTAPQPAPPSAAPQWRGLVAAGMMLQPGKTSFTDNRSTTVFRETATTTGDYDIDGGVGVDIGGYVRLWRNVGAGAAVTSLSRAGEAAFSTSSPHPFFFSRPRTATAAAADLDRTETGVHLSVAYLVSGASSFTVTVFAGPSIYSVTQPAVEDLPVGETYPYDTITLTAGRTTDLSKTAVGFHTGADATWFFTRRIGAGALVRFVNASAKGSVGGGDDFTLELGGAQVALGLRMRF